MVVTPHVYPPSITGATFLGTALWDQSRSAFGYLQAKGVCPDGRTCRRFPIVIGETGSALSTDVDKQWLRDFAQFVNAEVREVVGKRWGRACSTLWLARALAVVSQRVLATSPAIGDAKRASGPPWRP